MMNEGSCKALPAQSGGAGALLARAGATLLLSKSGSQQWYGYGAVLDVHETPSGDPRFPYSYKVQWRTFCALPSGSDRGSGVSYAATEHLEGVNRCAVRCRCVLRCVPVEGSKFIGGALEQGLIPPEVAPEDHVRKLRPEIALGSRSRKSRPATVSGNRARTMRSEIVHERRPRKLVWEVWLLQLAELA